MSHTRKMMNEKVWGQGRLFAKATWPGKGSVERQGLADGVVDQFHAAMRELELDVRWVPRQGMLVVADDDVAEFEAKFAEVEAALEAAYTTAQPSSA